MAPQKPQQPHQLEPQLPEQHQLCGRVPSQASAAPTELQAQHEVEQAHGGSC